MCVCMENLSPFFHFFVCLFHLFIHSFIVCVLNSVWNFQLAFFVFVFLFSAHTFTQTHTHEFCLNWSKLLFFLFCWLLTNCSWEKTKIHIFSVSIQLDLHSQWKKNSDRKKLEKFSPFRFLSSKNFYGHIFLFVCSFVAHFVCRKIIFIDFWSKLYSGCVSLSVCVCVCVYVNYILSSHHHLHWHFSLGAKLYWLLFNVCLNYKLKSNLIKTKTKKN